MIRGAVRIFKISFFHSQDHLPFDKVVESLFKMTVQNAENKITFI